MEKTWVKGVEYLKREDAKKLRELSERIMDEAVLDQDKEKVELAVLYYALSKMVSKVHFTKEKKWEEFKKKAVSDLLSGKKVDEIIGEIIKFDQEYGNYLTNVIEKARIKYASTAYALGMSMSSACELTGANMTEVSAYVGQTKIHERPFTQTKSIRERIKLARMLIR